MVMRVRCTGLSLPPTVPVYATVSVQCRICSAAYRQTGWNHDQCRRTAVCLPVSWSAHLAEHNCKETYRLNRLPCSRQSLWCKALKSGAAKYQGPYRRPECLPCWHKSACITTIHLLPSSEQRVTAKRSEWEPSRWYCRRNWFILAGMVPTGSTSGIS